MAQLKALVDKLLTNVSSQYQPDGYISEALMPKVSVVQSSGLLGKYGNSHLRIEHSLIGGRGRAKRVETITRSTKTYLIEEHGLEGVVTPDDYRNVEQPYDAERDEALGISTILWLGKEKALADTLGNTAVLTQNTTLSGTAQFNDFANSNPIKVFADARLAVKAGCGVVPDTAVMSWEVMNQLAYHPGILDALGYTFARAGQLNEAELAKAMGVKKLLIGNVSYNSSKEGQSDSLAAVWGKNIIFAVLPDTAAKYQVSLGYYLVFADQGPRKVYKYDLTSQAQPGATGILVQDSYDMLISNAAAGYLIKNAIA